jgi:hypothetical protein
MTQYRLLRNNKESGPYTAEQLIRMGLKAYDLIWVDGKSAAWRYPSEIPELAAYAPPVEEQPFDRFYTKPGTKTQPGNTTQPAQEAAPAKAESQPAIPTSTHAKPRIRIRADWRKVENDIPVAITAQPPAANKPAVPAQKASPAGVGWEEAMQSWQQEQQAHSHPDIPAKDEPVETTIKYSASLDSLKKRYEETVLKARNNFSGQQWLRYGLGLLLLPAFGLAMWLGKKSDPVPPADTAATQTTTVNKETPSVLSANDLKETPPAEETAVTSAVPASRKRGTTPGSNEHQRATTHASTAKDQRSLALNSNKKPLGNKTIAAAGNNKKAGAKDSNAVLPANTAAGKKPLQVAGAATGTSTAVPPQDVAKTTTPATSRQSQAAQSAPPYNPPPAPSRKQISDFVTVNEEAAGAADKKLHVKNLSNMPVDLVVVDLQYYDNRGRFQKGETMYVNHLAPKDEVALQPPAGKNGQRMTYKVSLLSIEKKGIYLIAD